MKNDNELPATWDWRTKGAVPPVGNTGPYGSAILIDSMNAIQAISFIKNGSPFPDLSTQ